MPKTRVQKKEIVAKLKDRLQKMKSLVFIDFTGLKAKEIEELRNTTKKEQGEYFVAKKTLIDLAVEEARKIGISLEGVEAKKLEGEISLLFGYSDETACMRLAETFSRDHKALHIRGGILDTKFLNAEQVVVLAKLPSRLELLAKVLRTLQAPLSGIVGALQGNLRGLVMVLSQIKK